MITHRGAILRLTLVVCALAAFAAFVPAIAGAATITPSITSDENTDNGSCSLREAVTAANTDGVYNGCSVANDGPDTITLQSSVTYSLTLPGEDALNAIGDLDVVAEPLTINVDGAFQATIDGNGDGIGDPGGIPTNDRILEIDPLAAGGVTSVSLTKLAITDGNGDGAIRVGGPTSLAITGSRLFANHGGGGITALRQDNGAISIAGTSIDTNTGGAGAIIQQFGTLDIERSTISGNTATAPTNDGGAILKIGGTLTLTDSTVSGNRSEAGGGGIWQNVGTTHLRNATIANNTADNDGDGNGDGGGVFNTGTGTVNARNSLLGDNTDASSTGNDHDDCSGTLTGQGYNLIESTTGCTLAGDATGNVTGANPMLASLADNGGPTLTQALLPGSPALNAANPATPGGADPNACPATDQRGFPRGGTAGRCDIGAFELQQQAPVLPTIVTAVPVTTPAATKPKKCKKKKGKTGSAAKKKKCKKKRK